MRDGAVIDGMRNPGAFRPAVALPKPIAAIPVQWHPIRHLTGSRNTAEHVSDRPLPPGIVCQVMNATVRRAGM